MKLLTRRDMIRLGLLGSGSALLGLDRLAGVPVLDSLSHTVHGLIGRSSLDAFHNMARLAAGDIRRLPLSSTAFAQTANTGYAVVTIKVLNHVFTPLVFAPGRVNGSTTQVDVGIVRPSTRGGRASAMLAARGADTISDMPRYAALRLNKWFAAMLHNGTLDGAAKSATNVPAELQSDVSPLSSDRVALQAFLHLKQIAGQNHSLKGTKLRQDVADLALFAEESGLVVSPLGLTALMMGGEYDKAEGVVPANAVLGGAGESVVVQSRRVREFAAQMRQFTGGGYVSRRALASNVTFQLDRLVEDDAPLRKELLASVDTFRNALGRLDSASALEQRVQAFDPASGNGQSNMPGSAAGFEFLGQVKYVTECLRLPGRPLTNFSLFLNVNDLDGKDLDATANQVNPGQDDNAVRALSYVEGMRQLAVGLNALGALIAAGEKLIVCVVTEGGRGAAMQDGKTGFAIVMGPKGPGLLDDQLCHNAQAFGQTGGPVVTDPAAENAAVAWTTGDGLKGKGGNALSGRVADMGDVQMGVVEFLEEKSGVKARTNLVEDAARYAKLKRKA